MWLKNKKIIFSTLSVTATLLLSSVVVSCSNNREKQPTQSKEAERNIVVKNIESKETQQEIEKKEIEREKELEKQEIEKENKKNQETTLSIDKDQKINKMDEFKKTVEKILFDNNNTLKVIEDYKNQKPSKVYDKKSRGGELIELDYVINKQIFPNFENHRFYMTKTTKSDDELGLWKNVELVIKDKEQNQIKFTNLKIIGFLQTESEATKMNAWLTQKENINEELKEFYPSLIGVMLLNNERNANIDDFDETKTPNAWFGNIDNDKFLNANSSVSFNPSIIDKFVNRPEQNPIKYNARVVAVQFDDFKGTLSLKMEIFGLEEYRNIKRIEKIFNYSGFKTIDIKNEQTHPLKMNLSSNFRTQLEKRKPLKSALKKILTENKDNLDQELLSKLNPSQLLSLHNSFKNTMAYSVNENDISSQIRNISNEEDFKGDILKRYGSGQNIGIFPMAAAYIDNSPIAIDGQKEKENPLNMLELKSMTITKIQETGQLWVKINYKTRYFLSRPNIWISLSDSEFSFVSEPVEQEKSFFVPYQNFLRFVSE